MIMVTRILGILMVGGGCFLGGGIFLGKMPYEYDQMILLLAGTCVAIGLILSFVDQFSRSSTVMFIVAGLITLVSLMMYVMPEELSPGPDLIPLLSKIRQLSMMEDTVITQYIWGCIAGVNVVLWFSAIVRKRTFD